MIQASHYANNCLLFLANRNNNNALDNSLEPSATIITLTVLNTKIIGDFAGRKNPVIV